MRMRGADNVRELKMRKEGIGYKLGSFLSTFHRILLSFEKFWSLILLHYQHRLGSFNYFFKHTIIMDEKSKLPSSPGASPTTLHEEKMEGVESSYISKKSHPLRNQKKLYLDQEKIKLVPRLRTRSHSLRERALIVPTQLM